MGEGPINNALTDVRTQINQYFKTHPVDGWDNSQSRHREVIPSSWHAVAGDHPEDDTASPLRSSRPQPKSQGAYVKAIDKEAFSATTADVKPEWVPSQFEKAGLPRKQARRLAKYLGLKRAQKALALATQDDQLARSVESSELPQVLNDRVKALETYCQQVIDQFGAQHCKGFSKLIKKAVQAINEKAQQRQLSQNQGERSVSLPSYLTGSNTNSGPAARGNPTNHL